MKIRNIFGNRYRGTLGKDVTASSWKGHDYIKEYVVPTDPKSELQMKHRALFKDAIRAWKALTPLQKLFYKKIADGMTGYNVFLGRYIERVRKGLEPEEPIEMEWHTSDGKPVLDGWLIVRHGGKDLFKDHLEDCRAVVALTPSDAPYVFVLVRGGKEDIVMTMGDMRGIEVPLIVESRLLEVKLVEGVQTTPIQPFTGANR